jgi:hypothetical protein
MKHNFRKLLVTSVATGAVIAGGSVLASALEIQSGATPAQLTTPAAVSRSITVEAHKDLPAVSVEQALPVSARSTGSMPIQGAWDRQTPAAVNVDQPLGHVDVAQSIGQITVPVLTVNMPANADYGVSTKGASTGVYSNAASTDAAVSTNGPALAEASTTAPSINNKLTVAGS